MDEEFKRKLTAILSADVAGYSRLMDDNEEATIGTLKEYRSLVAETVEQYRGRVVDSPGDNILVEFASVVDAVKCAVEIQQGLHKKNAELSDDRKMLFRIGINLGDVVEEDDRIYGEGVNIAARVESLADAGGICISGTAYDQVVNKLDLKYENMGEHQVKNIRRPVRVYKIPVEIEFALKKDEAASLDSLIDISVPTDKPSIAVLPFVNISGDPEQEYFSDGMTEAIITALAKVPDTLVVARNSTFVFKGKAVDVKQVGKELGVKYVLEGSVQKAGNRIRLTAQLIDAISGNHLWAERYDRDLKDIFDLQDELTLRILSELDIRFYHNIDARLKIKGTDNLDAYFKWWQGINLMYQLSKNHNIQARKLFMDVIKLDPKWAGGYALLATLNISDYWNGWSSSSEKHLQEAMELSQKAILLDDSMPDSYCNLSHVYFFKGQLDEAIAKAEKAIELQPNFFYGYMALGSALYYSGKQKKAQEAYKKAIRFSPKNHVLYFTVGASNFYLEKYNEAVAFLKQSSKLSPDFIYTRAYLALIYIFTNRIDEARNQAQEILRIDPKFSVENISLTIPYKSLSDTDRILNALRKAGLK